MTFEHSVPRRDLPSDVHRYGDVDRYEYDLEDATLAFFLPFIVVLALVAWFFWLREGDEGGSAKFWLWNFAILAVSALFAKIHELNGKPDAALFFSVAVRVHAAILAVGTLIAYYLMQ
ncbi:MAG: hypothetical protein CSA82_03225 [Actinobacteria bacterium]|nr:MAG: hypothetical protein CSA82_03225 [Actinomycetota bacterium]